MTIDDRDPIVSCEELITVVNCAENIPKNIHLISYTGIADLREIFKDQTTTIKTILSLPQLAHAKQLVNNLIFDNERLAHICLDNATQIDSIKETITQIELNNDKLLDQIAQLQNELSYDRIDKYYNKYVSDTQQELECMKNDVLDKKIGFEKYLKDYEMLKSQLISQQILKQIYNK
ncbi:hypothetical protein BMR1_03g02010 [Babesia microti strain RI]|uniref:Uncharacterized protein n=1 Tax=Babesia microti (strain RI) TaxID=1133968 RepID=A0A0K3ATW6_BABMR|nr:hypothetical protein BMR1_03g02010 [Babesia microti strain RI]CTQ41001.1 hypothetical protein BMR1_03g02010 [Babesia microti strain RI]|eukprot:XP_012649012.1 hypothetical protein BMR1_03g02010 [Babesia microti strain RI]